MLSNRTFLSSVSRSSYSSLAVTTVTLRRLKTTATARKEEKKRLQQAIRIATMFTLTPITHPTSDTKHPLLHLQSEHGERYLFGKICEGSQRTFTESKTRLSKLENIFLTGELDWSSIGGLPGMILTVSDQGKKTLGLFYGNDVLEYIISTWRYFVFRFGMELTTNTLRDSEIYKDKLICVKAIVVKKPVESSEEDSLTSKLVSSLRAIVSRMFPQHEPSARYDPSSDPYMNVELPKEIHAPKISTCYEIIFNPVRGKFKLEEAIKLGVPKGPLFAKLTKGEAVQLPNGTTVQPEQVLEKQRDFAKVLILDIPSDEYLTEFVKRFEKYDLNTLGSVYYFLGENVTVNENLFQFMEIFDNGHAQHFVSHPSVSPNSLVFLGSALTTLKLKALQVENYNLPITDRVFSKEFYDCFGKSLPKGTSRLQVQETPVRSKLDSKNVHVFVQQKGILIEPYTKKDENIKVKLCDNARTNFSWKKLYNDHVQPLKIPGSSYDKVIKDQVHTNNFDTKDKRGKVEIITLGTGSALPSKYRNVLSTLVKVPYISGGKITNRNVLLDAGENTLGTIHRLFPSADVQILFQDLKLIYLSHLHADHHLGIVSVLKEWYKYNSADETAKIYLVTPWQYNKFINEWFSLEDHALIERIQYISCEHLVDGGYVRKEIKPISLDELDSIIQPSSKKRRLQLVEDSSFRNLAAIKQMYKDLKIMKFQTCRAKHCDWAYSNAISFFMNSNSRTVFKLSYSGDTRPNIDKFAKTVGYRSDLLIHEATLDNELEEDAIKKRHCTINEAISVSNAMEAEKLVLTHFSQRYPKLPQMDNNTPVQAKEFCFAFDGMITSFDKLGEQQEIFTLLNKVFIEEREATEEDEGSADT